MSDGRIVLGMLFGSVALLLLAIILTVPQITEYKDAPPLTGGGGRSPAARRAPATVPADTPVAASEEPAEAPAE
jgi:hypothetical protein